MASISDVILHWIHVLFVSVWVGSLAVFLASYKIEGFQRFYSQLSKIMLASLILVALTGLANAFEYGGPGSWFRFGTLTGRIGEKIIAFILIAAIMGYVHHSMKKRGSITSRDVALVGLSMILSFGAMILGVMITLGFS